VHMARRPVAPAESLNADRPLLASMRPWSRAALALRADGLRYGAAVASAYAAFLHDVVVPEHAAEFWGYGLFFVLTTALQFFYAGALLFWPRRSVFLAGAAGNAAVLALYVVSRTVGVPLLGPHAGRPEPVGAVDLACAIVEVALVLALVRLLRDLPAEAPASRPAMTPAGQAEE